jgi:nucleotide-binding universal stress UspA family protein
VTFAQRVPAVRAVAAVDGVVRVENRLGYDLDDTAGIPTKVELDSAMAGHVARIIVEAAREYQVGVIVMGSHGRGDLTALLLGSVAHKVLHLADRPVLIAR